MKLQTCKRPSADRASVLVIALVISAIGTLGVLATVSVIRVRSNQAESHSTGLNRRIIERNSIELGKEVIYQSYLPQSAIIATETTFQTTAPAGSPSWARITIGEFDEPALSFSDLARTHPTGASPLRVFSNDVLVGVSDGGFVHEYQFQLRSYNPMLAGDLLSVHPTTESTEENMRISGDLNVNGRAVFWERNDYNQTVVSTLQSEELVVASQTPPRLPLEDPAGNPIRPSNFLEYEQTMGQVGGNNSYSGVLSLVDNPSTGVNSYFARLASLGGEASIDGNVGSTNGLGLDTAPPLSAAVDATLIGLIQDPSQTEATVVQQLTAASRLSSNVMLAMLQRTPAISNSFLLPLLQFQAPLPDDVMIYLANPNSLPNQTTNRQILESTQYSYISDGNGTVIIDLESIYLPNLAMTDVTQLILNGQNNLDTDNTVQDENGVDVLVSELQPRAFAIKNSDNLLLSQVILEGLTNDRRIALAISQTGVLDVGTDQTRFGFTNPAPFPRWKMFVETEGVSQFWDVSNVPTPNGMSLVGGIRTDHSIEIAGGALTLNKEEEFSTIESLLSRNAWIEIYR